MKIFIGICIGYAICSVAAPWINPLLAKGVAWVKEKLGVKED